MEGGDNNGDESKRKEKEKGRDPEFLGAFSRYHRSLRAYLRDKRAYVIRVNQDEASNTTTFRHPLEILYPPGEDEVYRGGLYFHLYGARVAYVGYTARPILQRQQEHFRTKEKQLYFDQVILEVDHHKKTISLKDVEAVYVICLPCAAPLARFLEGYFLQEFQFSWNTADNDHSKPSLSVEELFNVLIGGLGISTTTYHLQLPLEIDTTDRSKLVFLLVEILWKDGEPHCTLHWPVK